VVALENCLLKGITLTGNAGSGMTKLGLGLCSCIFVLSLAVAGGDGIAATKKIIRKKSDFTTAQRAKLLEDARKICVKRYGTGSRVYKLDYAKWRVTCTEPGW
jgi:hypothetical protein